jgi:hypothetical protein
MTSLSKMNPRVLANRFFERVLPEISQLDAKLDRVLKLLGDEVKTDLVEKAAEKPQTPSKTKEA